VQTVHLRAHDLLSIEKSDLFEKHIKNQYFFCDGVTSVMDKIKNVFCRLTNAYGGHVNRVTKRARILLRYRWKTRIGYLSV